MSAIMSYTLPQAQYLGELAEARKGRGFAVMARVVRMAHHAKDQAFNQFVRTLEDD